MDQRRTLVAWLNDAYAMERGIIPMLENHAKDATDHPEVRGRIERHITETRTHAEQIKGCLEALGERPSAMKTGMSMIRGTLQAPGIGLAHDGLVRNTLEAIATEHFEIACYTALRAAADQLGEAYIAQVCERICEQERRMADWFRDHLPATVHEHMSELALR